jgi:hypothetical protein
MSTLTYKARNRYAVGGWTDPRTAQKGPTGFEDVATDVLRNLWLVKFGGRVVSVADMSALREDDISRVGLELVKRKQIRHETNYRADLDETLYYYVLEKEDGNH